MKSILLALAVCLGLITAGCAEETVYAQQPQLYTNSNVVYCDDFGCRDLVNATYYYDSNNDVVYWDSYFGCWISQYGYYSNGVWYNGWWPGYHNYYGAGLYHEYGWRGYGLGWHARYGYYGNHGGYGAFHRGFYGGGQRAGSGYRGGHFGGGRGRR